MTIRIFLYVDSEEETPEAAYHALLRVLGASPFNESWGTTDEWYDDAGDPLGSGEIHRARTAVLREREKERTR
jgi:hypothetical protein